MSGDRLGGKAPYRIGGIPSGIISADDYDVTDEALDALARYDALVEIAKAARVLLDEYEDEETEHGFPFNFALRDAHRSLRSALARLDSGATEGDA